MSDTWVYDTMLDGLERDADRVKDESRLLAAGFFPHLGGWN
jgi:hypothetical protein